MRYARTWFGLDTGGLMLACAQYPSWTRSERGQLPKCGWLATTFNCKPVFVHVLYRQLSGSSLPISPLMLHLSIVNQFMDGTPKETHVRKTKAYSSYVPYIGIVSKWDIKFNSCRRITGVTCGDQISDYPIKCQMPRSLPHTTGPGQTEVDIIGLWNGGTSSGHTFLPFDKKI